MQISAAARIRMVFFLHALSSGGLYPRIPDIQHAINADAASLGFAFLGFTMGNILSFLFSSRLIEKAGTRPILIATIPCLGAGTALLAAMPSAPALFVLFLFYGVLYALPNTAMNIEADRVEAMTQRRVMNSCHGVWSIGYLLSTLIGTLAAGLTVSPFVHLGLLALPLIPLGLWVTLPLAAAPPRRHVGTGAKRLALPTVPIVLLVLFTIGPALLEGGVRNWSVIYMRDSFSAPAWVDTLTLPVFLVAQSAGRLSADGLVMRFGAVPVARALTLLGMLGAIAVVLAPGLAVALPAFLLIGVGVCISYPLTTSAAARLGDRPSSENVASLTLAQQVVLLGSPAAMGLIAHDFGIRTTFAVLLPFVIASLWLARFLEPGTARETERPA